MCARDKLCLASRAWARSHLRKTGQRGSYRMMMSPGDHCTRQEDTAEPRQTRTGSSFPWDTGRQSYHRLVAPTLRPQCRRSLDHSCQQLRFVQGSHRSCLLGTADTPPLLQGPFPAQGDPRDRLWAQSFPEGSRILLDTRRLLDLHLSAERLWLLQCSNSRRYRCLWGPRLPALHRMNQACMHGIRSARASLCHRQTCPPGKGVPLTPWCSPDSSSQQDTCKS